MEPATLSRMSHLPPVAALRQPSFTEYCRSMKFSTVGAMSEPPVFTGALVPEPARMVMPVGRLPEPEPVIRSVSMTRARA